MKSKPKPAALIRNVVEVPWQEFPGHFGGALGIRVHHGSQFRALRFVNDAAVVFPELPRADYRQSGLRHP